MDALSNIGVLLGTSWASGVNLYLTVAGLGIADRLGMVSLPGNMDVVSHPLIIAVAVLMAAVEFFADKIPVVDSAWDSVHTFIMPAGGALLGFMAMADMGPVAQIPVALLTGAVAADSHLTKATTRVAINTSPEPITNSVASLTEDGLVLTMLYLVIKHPVIATVCVICFIIFSIWFLKVMFKFVKKAFKFLTGKKEEKQE
ncbi:MAG: DUF4126 domain-containing protein [Candidatus Orphnella occulta]|nr:DUF4126 domain-containing protein [Candidatus Orphnella occulta]